MIEPTSAQEKSSTRTPASGPRRTVAETVASGCSPDSAREPAGALSSVSSANRRGARRPSRVSQKSRATQVRIGQHIGRRGDDTGIDAASPALDLDLRARPRLEEGRDRLLPLACAWPDQASSGCRSASRRHATDSAGPPRPSSRRAPGWPVHRSARSSASGSTSRRPAARCSAPSPCRSSARRPRDAACAGRTARPARR